MRPGQWLQPRHGSEDIFLKDFPHLETGALEVSCPGCRTTVRLSRKSPAGKIGGWCKTCNRGVAP